MLHCFVTSAHFGSIAWEHWQAVRSLSEEGLYSSSIAMSRIQFEALIRSIWCLYCATDSQIEKLNKPLSSESEHSAKNLPQVSEMLNAIEKVPVAVRAFIKLVEFKDYSWKALNSFVHAGIHPLRRQAEGYPLDLILQVIRHSNGLGVLIAMQLAILTGQQTLQKSIISLCEDYENCLPPRMENATPAWPEKD